MTYRTVRVTAFVHAAILGLFAVLFQSGCATTFDSNQYVRDGVQYGVTEGQFRGRWWNHYQRARSFMEGGYWAEAERDLRIAMAGRARDHRWARTYGLHFLPEYFPNRELGIVLYQLDQLEASNAYLETSLRQSHSALAAHFIGRVRRAKVEAAGTDLQPPQFQLARNATDPAISDLETYLEGVARDDTYVAAVWVDGVPYPIDVSAPEVAVRHPVTLQPGDNLFTVTVEDIMGRRTEERVHLALDSDGPVISFDDVAPGAATVSGVAFDPSGVARLEINGHDVALAEQADGTVYFEAGLHIAGAADVSFVCVDTLGNRTSGTLASFGSPRIASHRPIQIAMAASVDAALLASMLHVDSEDSRIGLAQAAPAAGPRVRFLDPIDGRIFRSDEIAVAVELESDTPLEMASLNGSPISVIPGRSRQRSTRRIRLDGPGSYEVAAEAVDTSGQRTLSAVQVERQPTEVDAVGKLSAALLGITGMADFVDGASGENYSGAVNSWLYRDLLESKRFSPFVERDAALLQTAITEQQLGSLLSSKSEVAAVGQVITADLLIVGKFHRLPDSIEIILEAKDPQLLGDEGVVTVAFADVAGTANSAAELQDLVNLLALRFLQQIPRVQGAVRGASGDRIFAHLGAPLGIKRYQRAIVFRPGESVRDDTTGEILDDGLPEIIGEAIIDQVRPEDSILRLIERREAFLNETISSEHIVATK